MYKTESICGNFYDLARHLNEYHPDWELISAECSGYNTIFIVKVPDKKDEVKDGLR